MDGVSGASGALAVVSLALQLAEGCTRLYKFWNSIQDAPSEVAAMLEDIGNLSHVLHGISRNANMSPAVAFGLRCCQRKISVLNAIVEEFEQALYSSKGNCRFWASFKAVIKSKRLRFFRESLADAKSTLLLTLMQECIREPRKHFNLDVFQTNECASLSERSARDKPRNPIQGISESGSRRSSYAACEPPTIRAAKDKSQTALMIDNPMCQAVLKQSCQLALTDLFESGNLAQLVSETICRVNTLEVMPSGTYTFDGIGIRENSFAVDGAKWQTLDEVVPSSIRRFGRRSLTYHAISSRRILMGKIWICKANISLEAGATPFARRSEVITTLIFHPAAWFMRMGFRYGLEASFSPSLHGFRFDFKTARAVPDDSLIFELCERGDLIGVRRLMERGDASVYDRNSKGWTPLHVASANGHVKMCAALIDMGADKANLAFVGPQEDALSPIAIFAAAAQDLPSEEKIGMLRLFADCLDLSEPSSEGWIVLCHLAQSSQKEKVPVTHTSVLWMTRLTSTEKFVSMGPKIVWHAVQYVIRAFIGHERNNQIVQNLLDRPKDKGSEGTSRFRAVAHWVALRASQRELLPMVLEVGSLLDLQGFEKKSDDITPIRRSRMMPAIYATWARKLPSSIERMEHIIALELEELSRKLSWTPDFLLQAVSKPEKDEQVTANYQCSECSDDYSRLGAGLVEPGWVAFNECTRTSHKFDCKCTEFLRHTRAADKSTDVDGSSNLHGEFIRTFEEPVSQICEDYARFHVVDRVSDPLRDAATLLYQAQGRTWQGVYGPNEVLCSTCFLKRELYIRKDGKGTEHEYPPVPKSYEAFYPSI